MDAQIILQAKKEGKNNNVSSNCKTRAARGRKWLSRDIHRCLDNKWKSVTKWPWNKQSSKAKRYPNKRSYSERYILLPVLLAWFNTVASVQISYVRAVWSFQNKRRFSACRFCWLTISGSGYGRPGEQSALVTQQTYPLLYFIRFLLCVCKCALVYCACCASLQPHLGPAAKRSRKSDPVKFLPTLPAVSVIIGLWCDWLS